MRTPAIATALALLQVATPAARADLVLTQHLFVGAAKTPAKTVMYVKGGKIRTDNDTTSSSIIDTETGDMTTLVHELRRRDGRYGLATMCIGVGQGIATVIEHLDRTGAAA